MSNEQNDALKVAKQQLGKLIVICRGSLSQRKLASAIGLPPSNMKYIEDGINAPTLDIYSKIVIYLHPNKELLRQMDDLFVLIRGTPPPDVCRIINNNSHIYDAVRLLGQQPLTHNQLSRVYDLFSLIAAENKQ